MAARDRKEYMREYWRKRRESPEVRERERLRQLEYDRRPEVKSRRKQYMREYAKEYLQRPEVKERVREYQLARRQDPEVRARRREYDRKYRKRKRSEREREQHPDQSVLCWQCDSPKGTTDWCSECQVVAESASASLEV